MSQRGNIRLIPVVIVALGALAILKIAGLALVGGGALSPIPPATAQTAEAQDAASGADPAAAEAGAPESSADESVAADPAAAAAADPAADPAGGSAAITVAGVPAMSDSEKAVLESLRKRREELDARDQALAMRENLLTAAEQRIDGKIEELKAMEARIQASIKEKEEADDERFAGLVTMYESMKPKAAARIFDLMDVDVVVGVARRMDPEALAKIVAAMEPGAAERVTIEIAQMSAQGTGFGPELDAIAPQ